MVRLLVYLVCFIVITVSSALGEQIRIVALGTSGTYGKDVAREEAFPARIEALLKNEGYDVVVKNEGVNGNTTQDMLARFEDAVPEGTRIVILQPGSNDQVTTKRRSGVPAAVTIENVEKMLSRLKERNISVILFKFLGGEGAKLADKYGATLYGSIYGYGAKEFLLSDGQHLTPAGHEIVAEKMVPLIKQLLSTVPERKQAPTKP